MMPMLLKIFDVKIFVSATPGRIKRRSEVTISAAVYLLKGYDLSSSIIGTSPSCSTTFYMFARPLIRSTCRSSSRFAIRYSSIHSKPPPFPTIPTCPSPTCACAETPAMPDGFHIDHSKGLNGTMAAYAEQVLICTGKEDWTSKIEEENSGDNLAADIKELVGRGGIYSDVNSPAPYFVSPGCLEPLANINLWIAISPYCSREFLIPKLDPGEERGPNYICLPSALFQICSLPSPSLI